MRPAGVFVYGTLKSGERHAREAEAAGLVRREPALARGIRLFDLPYGYPAAVPGEGQVEGELLVFEDLERALERLDRFEGDEYQRRVIEVETPRGRVAAWVYLYPGAEEAEAVGGTPVPGGVWRGRLPGEP